MEKTETSVAQPLSRVHAALLEDLRRLEDVARGNTDQILAALRACLGAARRDIAEHFRAQEQSGYLDTIQKQQPRLAPAIHRLAEEHRQLTQALEALMGEAAVATVLGDGLRAQIHDWIGRVRRHEAAHETDFIQEAFGRDIGVEG